MHPDQAWGSLARLAARFGLGPRPSQTVFEYAGALGDAVPAARLELTTIARAKVEVAYGRRDLGDDRLRAHRRGVPPAAVRDHPAGDPTAAPTPRVPLGAPPGVFLRGGAGPAPDAVAFGP